MDPELNHLNQVNKYCTLCGVVLLCEELEEIPETRRPWYAEVRAVAKEEFDRIFVTGVGFLDSRDVLCAPLDEELDYSNATELDDVELLRTESELHGFGLHDSCWMLLQDRLWHMIDSDIVADSLYDQFYCTPAPLQASLSFGHDYGGAEQWQEVYDTPVMEKIPPLMRADPYAIPLLEKLEEKALDVDTAQEYHSTYHTRSTDSNIGYQHSFGRLSLELFHEIVSYLSVSELLALKCTSRELVQRVIFSSLPPSFWKRQFTPGYSMDFLFPDLEQKRDWFRLYRGTMSILQANDESSEMLSLLNRKRIRALLEPIASVVEADAERSKEPSGRRANCMEFSPGKWLVSEGLFQWRAENIYTGYRSLEDDFLPHGCHVPRYRIGDFPHTMLHGGEIEISTVQLGGRVFISGIDHNSDDPQGLLKRQAVGHELLTGHVTIDIPPGTIFNQIEVAFCAEGVRGIRFHYAGNTTSEWVGDTDDKEMSYGVLQVPHSDSGLYHLFAGTDAYKLTAIGTVHDEKLDDMADNSFWRDYPLDLTLPDSYLWQSARPSYENLRIYQFQPDSVGTNYRPLINIDFGGPDGKWLESLVSMEVHVSNELSPIVGMSFKYTDKTLQFGICTSEKATSFPIDGPGGERITDVLAYTTGAIDCSSIYGLQVVTTLGRKQQFVPHNPYDGSGSPGMTGGDLQSLDKRPEGGIITGFVVTKRWDEDHFIEMGIQFQLCNEDRS
ncbi:hypothetical protein BDV25DRAFT_171265 [Aspergillus avenaceus]|uniref:DUF7600 domain-containing protein n=1 Tax=Aspergillus avenaceus TaxID=36643 RepID=A0A5N6TZA4_ASPAV|nr:hypothetical protein BDV25DRAFT_171265 [Aspergillus avenaceus]